MSNTQSNLTNKFLLLEGKSQDVLKQFPDNTFHAVVTSPPYWSLRDYFNDDQLGQESTPEEYVKNVVSIMREVKRTLRKDGAVWFNIGDSYNNSSGFCRATKGWDRKGRKKGSSDKKAVKHKTIKTKDLVGMPWRVAFALQEDGWYLRCDIVWCLSGGAEVYVKSNGREFPTSVKDLYRLDPSTVKLWNGDKWTQMVGMTRTPQKHDEIQFTLRNGERICCTPNHRWPTDRGVVSTDDLVIGDVLKTCSLPEPDVCSNPDHLPDDEIGWFVGIYLAEGSRSGQTIQISSHKKEIKRFEKLKSIAEKYHGTCHKYNTSDNGMTINIHSNVLNSIIDMYIGGRVAKDKYLSSLCWQRNNIFLKNILEGYLEGDGHFDKKNNRYRLGFTRNYCFERSLRTICARLNVFCTIKLAHSKIKEKTYKTFKGEIRFEKSNYHSCKKGSEILKIENDKGGREYFYDIEVEDEPNLFSLSSGVLTHNSKTNPMPDGAKDRPTRGHEYIFLLTKSPQYFYDYYRVLEDTEYHPDGVQGFGAKDQKGTFRMDQERTFKHYGKRNKRAVWRQSVSSFQGNHFATYPPKLIEPCIQASTSERGCCVECGTPWVREFEKVEVERPAPIDRHAKKTQTEQGADIFVEGGLDLDNQNTLPEETVMSLELESKGWKKNCKCETDETTNCLVLDPFNGTGTTGEVALAHGQRYVGIELNKEYLEIARDRLNSDNCFNHEVFTVEDILK